MIKSTAELSHPENQSGQTEEELLGATPRIPRESQTGRQESRANALVLLSRRARFFHTPDMTAYASFEVNDHLETWPVRSGQFRRWLQQSYYDSASRVPGGAATEAALQHLEGFAQFKGPEGEPCLRVGELDGVCYLDLCNDQWQIIRIGPEGWSQIEAAEAPVRFRRVLSMRSLPSPERGGSVDDLRPFVNLASESSWILLIGWLLSSFRPRGPYPVLLTFGEQGSGKSTLGRVLRDLIDPAKAPVQTFPRQERDLIVSALNSWLLVYDNLSSLSSRMSDSLCRISTGAGMSARTLFTDREATTVEVCRPAVLNGIENIATRPDLLDRSFVLELGRIDEADRRKESDFWDEFSEARPLILGALLDTLAEALRNLPTVSLPRSPRLADVTAWVTAAEPALDWEPYTFLQTYTDSAAMALRASLEGNLVAGGMLSLLEERGTWTGTASELLGDLRTLIPSDERRSRSWPHSPSGLGNLLRQLAPSLRATGVDIDFRRRPKTGSRVISMKKPS